MPKKFVILEMDPAKMDALHHWCMQSLTSHEFTYPLESFDSRVLAELEVRDDNDAMLFSMRWC